MKEQPGGCQLRPTDVNEAGNFAVKIPFLRCIDVVNQGKEDCLKGRFSWPDFKFDCARGQNNCNIGWTNGALYVIMITL